MKSLEEVVLESEEGARLYDDIFNTTFNFIDKCHNENIPGYTDDDLDKHIAMDLNSDEYKGEENTLVSALLSEYPKMDYRTQAQLKEYIKRNDNALCAKETIGTALVQAFVKYDYEKIHNKKYEGHI